MMLHLSLANIRRIRAGLSQRVTFCAARTVLLRAATCLLPLLAFVLASCNDPSTASGVRTPTVATAVTHSTPTVHPVRPALTNSSTSQLASQVDNLFSGLVAQNQFSGSVLIAKDGQIVLAKGYSMANWQTQTPNTPLTRFYLGSVTKEFTAMAILLLQQQGKLDVHKSICVYISPCPPPWQPVTIHNVLTHTSGIPELDTSQLSGDSPAAWIASFDAYPLQFTPGSEFVYCSVCYQILGYVVQQVSGMPYSQFMLQNIFQPLHMDATGFDSTLYYNQAIDAHGYDTWKNESDQLGWQMGPYWSFLFASGLLYSNVGDLYRWDQSLYTTLLFSQQTLNEAFTSYTSSSLFAGSTYG
ncbi:MAG TPA: serine hydrolase domain-containing protein, partial [Ktedonobacteraceae bacterium]|nr:serine hydrolase domain-containing protein [Ktedonobacteraceae bacterium]